MATTDTHTPDPWWKSTVDTVNFQIGTKTIGDTVLESKSDVFVVLAHQSKPSRSFAILHNRCQGMIVEEKETGASVLLFAAMLTPELVHGAMRKGNERFAQAFIRLFQCPTDIIHMPEMMVVPNEARDMQRLPPADRVLLDPISHNLVMLNSFALKKKERRHMVMFHTVLSPEGSGAPPHLIESLVIEMRSQNLLAFNKEVLLHPTHEGSLARHAELMRELREAMRIQDESTSMSVD